MSHSNQAQASVHTGTMQTVDSVSGWSLAQVMDYVENTNKPMVFKGLCHHWPVVQAGLESADKALDYLRQFYQGNAVTAYYLPPEQQGRVFYNEQLNGFNYQAGRLDFNQLVSRLQQENASPTPAGIYMGSTDIHHFLPGLGEQNSLDISPINPLTSIWLGNKTKVAAHFDFPLNLACNVVGKRTFTLFPPEQISNLYVGPMEFAPGGQDISMVDFDKPDFELFPKFKQALAASLTAELTPGDVLFIPSMWWHHVRGIDDINVLITHWWRDTPGHLGRPNNALLHSVLSLRSLPKAQRQAWKAIFDHYIFEHDEVDDSYMPDDAKGMLSKPLDELNARKLRAELINKLKR